MLENSLTNLIGGEFENMNPFVKSDFKVEIKEFGKDEEKFHGRFIHYWDEPEVDEIPNIVEPSMHGMVEVMRGCGRGCKFCDVTLRPLRYYPPEKVKREIRSQHKKRWTTKCLACTVMISLCMVLIQERQRTWHQTEKH